MRKNDPDVGEIGRKLLPVLSNQKCNEYLKEIAPACPAIRRGLIIEVLFEEIFTIQRKVCTFVPTCYVNYIERIRHFSPN